jgi:hypothetical protein
MAVRSDKYRITWSSRAERADEQPETVSAHLYRVEGDFFAFYPGNPDFSPPILLVRMSDVQEIRRVDDNDG